MTKERLLKRIHINEEIFLYLCKYLKIKVKYSYDDVSFNGKHYKLKNTRRTKEIK